MLSDLETIGYATRAFTIPACAVDARHRRDRVWIVANLQSPEQQSTSHSRNGRHGPANRYPGSPAAGMFWQDGTRFAHTNSKSPQRFAIARSQCCEWLPEPDVGRVANGVPSRVDRLKGLGNAIVPQVAYEIIREIRTLLDTSLKPI